MPAAGNTFNGVRGTTIDLDVNNHFFTMFWGHGIVNADQAGQPSMAMRTPIYLSRTQMTV